MVMITEYFLRFVQFAVEAFYQTAAKADECAHLRPMSLRRVACSLDAAAEHAEDLRFCLGEEDIPFRSALLSAIRTFYHQLQHFPSQEKPSLSSAHITQTSFSPILIV